MIDAKSGRDGAAEAMPQDHYFLTGMRLPDKLKNPLEIKEHVGVTLHVGPRPFRLPESPLIVCVRGESLFSKIELKTPVSSAMLAETVDDHQDHSDRIGKNCGKREGDTVTQDRSPLAIDPAEGVGLIAQWAVHTGYSKRHHRSARGRSIPVRRNSSGRSPSCSRRSSRSDGRDASPPPHRSSPPAFSRSLPDFSQARSSAADR